MFDELWIDGPVGTFRALVFRNVRAILVTSTAKRGLDPVASVRVARLIADAIERQTGRAIDVAWTESAWDIDSNGISRVARLRPLGGR